MVTADAEQSRGYVPAAAGGVMCELRAEVPPSGLVDGTKANGR